MTAERAASEFWALLDAAVDAIIVIDERGTIKAFNSAAERMFDRSADEAIGCNVSLLMPEPYRSQHDSYLERYLTTGEARIIGIGREVIAQRADGTTFPMRLSVGRASGDPPRFVGIVHDISRQKDTEAALEQERDRAQSYLDLAEVMLLALDRNGCIALINRKGCEILQHDETALLGRNWFETCIPADEREAVITCFHRVIAGTAGSEIYENRVLTRTGQKRTIAWRNHPVTDGRDGVIGTLSCGEDVTEQRRTEEEVRRARERLAHVSRLSTMGEMAAGLAHEINQPLTAITAYAEACQRMLAQEDGTAAPQFTEALEQISSQALRAGEVIRRLRSMVRQRQAMRELVDCNQMVRGAIILAEADARANDIELVLDLAIDRVTVQVDEVQIQQVLLNLIRNAIDASEGNTVDRLILLRTRLHEQRIEIAVVDHGCGLGPDVGEELFNPFYTTKATGTGLGLSISHSIVRAHGGRLAFRRNDGPGTTFFFTLPFGRNRSREHGRSEFSA